ncbi:hypothetical protein M5C96_19710 [Acidovorax sp. GBBC 1281]|nr:hypothetical protein [Acidovorax sp. GBBC 1281]WCM96633.1 hypothetical protein M5C96_19710 [Acidovorax sp. GBBC 1281]
MTNDTFPPISAPLLPGAAQVLPKSCLRAMALQSPQGGPYSLDLNAGECVAITGP